MVAAGPVLSTAGLLCGGWALGKGADSEALRGCGGFPGRTAWAGAAGCALGTSSSGLAQLQGSMAVPSTLPRAASAPLPVAACCAACEWTPGAAGCATSAGTRKATAARWRTLSTGGAAPPCSAGMALPRRFGAPVLAACLYKAAAISQSVAYPHRPQYWFYCVAHPTCPGRPFAAFALLTAWPSLPLPLPLLLPLLAAAPTTARAQCARRSAWPALCMRRPGGASCCWSSSRWVQKGGGGLEAVCLTRGSV